MLRWGGFITCIIYISMYIYICNKLSKFQLKLKVYILKGMLIGTVYD